jgi:carboxymethylenebutenolidase
MPSGAVHTNSSAASCRKIVLTIQPIAHLLLRNLGLGDLGSVKEPLIVHIADKDEFFPPKGRAKVIEVVRGHKQIAAYVYPGADHAFARVGGTHRDGRSAAIANGRSAEALVAALG